MKTPSSLPALLSRKRLLLPLSVLLLGASGFLLFKSLSHAQNMPPRDMVTPVQVASARRADVPVYLNAIGTVSANVSATVTSRVDGVLQAVYFTEGQWVKQGQLLAQIDPRAYQASLKQYQGALAEHTALLHSAELTLERYRKLYASDSLAKQDLDSQIASVEQYRGEVKTDQAQIESARLNLDFTRITAPISGFAGLRLTDPGNMVHSTDTTGIVAISQSRPITATFSLPEANLADVLPLLRQGKALPVDAFNRERTTLLAHGEVKFISNAIDTSTGSVKLKAVFANTDDKLFPNQFVNIRLQTATLPQAVTVPAAAVQLGSNGSYVYVVNGNHTVSKKNVSTGPANGDWVVISKGVDASASVVTAGIDHLHEGARVAPVGDNSRGSKVGQ